MNQPKLIGQNRARTKTVATIGPACGNIDALVELIVAGVDVFRINMAHGTRQDHDQMVALIREASKRCGSITGILVDLAGPKFRLGELPNGEIDCHIDDVLTFVPGTKSDDPSQLTCNYPKLVDELSAGDNVMLADGTVGLTVESVENGEAKCRVFDSGLIRSRQGINLPGVALSVPALTEADLVNAEWAAATGVDFVSLSFVRTPKEINTLIGLLHKHGSDALVIAKIEKREALECLDEIVQVSGGVMVARGDLGVEIDVAEMPMEQKRIIRACTRWQKPVIVATQMLDSMQQSSRPTRAEATDVANAIIDGADACMLSGETAIGNYPLEAVKMMNRIMVATESVVLEEPHAHLEQMTDSVVHQISRAVISGAAHISHHLDARLIVIATRSGATALVQSKHRSPIRTLCASHREDTLRRVTLFWGIIPVANAPMESGPQLRTFLSEKGLREGWLEIGDRIVFVTGSEVVPQAHNLVVVHEVEE